MDIGITSPLGADPSASRVASSDFSQAVGLMCDIGLCLEALTKAQRTAIVDRWGMWFRREALDEEVAQLGRRGMAAMRTGAKHNRTDAQKRQRAVVREIAKLSAEIAEAERSADYVTGMRRFAVEVEARDLYARGSCNGRGRVSGL